ncbi:MAG TPA: HAD family phosphatase [Marmoricola sp.]|nr:HAD family phosphatase [Nocardioidaceae bacterium]MCB8992550.1 HAD family phosphatase [Nocardioidaceae bacterium]MCO5323641.1 HAD family phosphatase [Nocardioidaceae bacterium]HMU37051.1 HAD family phosphatase [Marmoricola sp.]HRV68387.1 HAD family phosphatase [Marmoricola sp.]
MPLKAVLWDMDGTLVDTEPYWFECEFEMAARYDAPWTEEHALNLVGLDLLDAAAYAKKHMGIEDLEPWQIRDEILEMVVTKLQGELPWRPGAMELLKEIKAAQIPTALVTMSYSSFVDPIIAAMPSGSFEVVVAGDQVSRGKPHPDPYLQAMSLLDVRPEDAVAIEDSPTGCASAAAAGCQVLAVPHRVSVDPKPSLHLVSSLTTVSLKELQGLVSRRRESSDNS